MVQLPWTFGRMTIGKTGYFCVTLHYNKNWEPPVTGDIQSNLQTRLKKTLKTSVETRWNSLHTMLESISSQYEDIRTLLEERGEVDRLTDLDKEALSDTVTFLE